MVRDFRLRRAIAAGTMLLSGISYYSSPALAVDLTTLRAAGAPRGTFQTRGGLTKIMDAQIKIQNVGTIEAKQINVFAVLPSGQRINLKGPGSLGPNKTAFYVNNSVNEIVTSSGSIKAEIVCSNCRE